MKKIIFIVAIAFLSVLVGAGIIDPTTQSSLQQKEIKNPFIK